MYEGYAPGGVALLIDVLTDNRNRTGAEIRGVFTKHGGSLAEPGSVSWQFARRGVDLVDGARRRGRADDGRPRGRRRRRRRRRRHVAGHDRCRRTTFDVRDALEAAGFTVESADTPMVSDNLVPIATVEEAKKVLRVVEVIEDNDDVQDVFANFDIPDDVMDAGRWSASSVSGDRCAGDRAPDFTLPGTGGPHVLAGRLRRPAGRARLLPGRRHAGLHEAAQRVQRRARRSSPTSAPRCWRSRPRTSPATSASRPSTAASSSRCSPTPTRRSPRLRHARPDRLPAAQRVHRRRRRRRPLRPPGHRRAHLPPGQRARRRAGRLVADRSSPRDQRGDGGLR